MEGYETDFRGSSIRVSSKMGLFKERLKYEEDMADLQIAGFRLIHVLVDVPLRVDDDGRSRLLVADQVGGMGETAQKVLLQDHDGALMSIEEG